MEAILQLNENYTSKLLIDFITGKATKEMKDYRFTKLSLFGVGQEDGDLFWHSIVRQSILNDLVLKEIEQYGVLKISEKGKAFLDKPYEIFIPLNRDFSDAEGDDIIMGEGGGASLDENLMNMLLDLRKREAKRHSLQPWIIFQEPALQEMATFYPISVQDLQAISGISQGKALKFGKPFIEMIKKYVEDNEIERTEDIVIKQVANKSKDKVTIIQGIDRKLSLKDIAKSVDLTYEELLEEMNQIVDSGTKLDINYFLEDHLDEDIMEEIFDYFHEASSDSVLKAYEELKEEDITIEEIFLARIQFMTEVVN